MLLLAGKTVKIIIFQVDVHHCSSLNLLLGNPIGSCLLYWSVCF